MPTWNLEQQVLLQGSDGRDPEDRSRAPRPSHGVGKIIRKHQDQLRGPDKFDTVQDETDAPRRHAKFVYLNAKIYPDPKTLTPESENDPVETDPSNPGP